MEDVNRKFQGTILFFPVIESVSLEEHSNRKTKAARRTSLLIIDHHNSSSLYVCGTLPVDAVCQTVQ